MKDYILYDKSDSAIDISDYPSVYILLYLYRDDGIKTIKYSLIK